MHDKKTIHKMLQEAKAAGATQSEVWLEQKTSRHASLRLDEIESLESSTKQQLALRVWVGKRKSLVATERINDQELQELAQRAVAIAQKTPEDAAARIASQKEFAASIKDCDLFEESVPSEKDLIARARTLEQAARAHKGITNSEGASCGFSHRHITLATSEGFYGSYAKSDHAIALSVIAGGGDDMERDYEFKHTTHWSDMGDVEALGKDTAARAVRRLGARKIASEALPVIFAPRVASSLLRHVIEALKGDRLLRQTSFLCGSFGERIMPEAITIVDDPHRKRGLRSRPFDSEGLAGTRSVIVENGVLKGRFLDLRTAHLLQLPATAHASRKVTEHPMPDASNCSIEKGEVTEAQLMANIARGLYVSELLGSSLNWENGDYSRGAAGFLIEGGELTHAVNEVTIAGNLKEVFSDLRAATNLEFKNGIDAPSLRSDRLMVAGK